MAILTKVRVIYETQRIHNVIAAWRFGSCFGFPTEWIGELIRLTNSWRMIYILSWADLLLAATETKTPRRGQIVWLLVLVKASSNCGGGAAAVADEEASQSSCRRPRLVEEISEQMESWWWSWCSMADLFTPRAEVNVWIMYSVRFSLTFMRLHKILIDWPVDW